MNLSKDTIKEASEKLYPIMSEAEWRQDDCEDYHTYHTRVLSYRIGYIAGTEWALSQSPVNKNQELIDSTTGSKFLSEEAVQKMIDESKTPAPVEEVTVDNWKIGDTFTTPETGDTLFIVSKVLKYDVEAQDARSRAGYTIFTKSYITKKVEGVKSAEDMGQIFEDNFDCYAKSDYSLMAMSKDKFISVFQQFKGSSPVATTIDTKLFLMEVLKDVKWMWDNLPKAHTSDHFNIPVNLIQRLEDFINNIRVQYAPVEQMKWIKVSDRNPAKNYIDVFHCNVRMKGTDENLFPMGVTFSGEWEIDDEYEVIEWLYEPTKEDKQIILPNSNQC